MVLLLGTRTMDELLLEGQEESGQLYCTPDLDLVSTILLQLYARRGTIPASVDHDMVDSWTTFQMMLREPGPIPPTLDLIRFLISSITFMTHLSEVSVYFDDKRLVRLSKDCSASKEVPMLDGLKGTSPDGMMNVKSIESTREFRFCFSSGRIHMHPLTALHIEAEVVRWVYNVSSEMPPATCGTDIPKTATHQTNGLFSPLFDGFEASSMPRKTSTSVLTVPKEPIDSSEATSSSVVLIIFAANVDVQLDKKMTGELLRSTLKKPPSRLRYELIYVSSIVVQCVLNIGFLVLLRWGRKNMTQASRRRRKRHMLPGVCFKGFGLIWKGSSHTQSICYN
jgi:hypothetical protein